MEPRQTKILNLLIKEYIRRFSPVGSEMLLRRHQLGVSPATVRNELLTLTKEGYLEQPHTSAGRIPTNRGWRFYVDTEVLEEPVESVPLRPSHSFEGLVEGVSQLANAFGVIIDETGDVFASGLPLLFSQPDFETRDQFERLAETVEILESDVDTIFTHLAGEGPNILIGRENAFFENDDISTLFTPLESANGVQSLAMLIGPKRMPYDRNWQILRSLEKIAHNINLR